ncbi:MAG: DUF4124 domain-containing protein [Betaproteobacteria bacterium]
MRTPSLAILLVAFAAGAGAEPVKCVDAAGKVHYIDRSAAGTMKCEPVKGKASIGIGSEAPATKPAPKSASAPSKPAPAGDPREAIIAAERRLAAARKALADQEAIREGGERNYARVEERLAPYRENVQAAERALEEARRQR